MKKKFILGASILALAIPSLVTANSNIRIWMKGDLVKSDVAPYIYEERTMVPLRVISENLGKEVLWDGANRSVQISDGYGGVLYLTIDKKEIKNFSAGNSNTIKLDVAPKIKDDRTFVPLRAIAEAFGEKVDWDKDKRVVVIGDGYDTKKIKDEKKDLQEKKEVLDPLGLDYLYNKDMEGKSDEEKALYEKKMREMPSKVFKGYKNGEVEACLAWLSFAKAGEFFGPELNKDPYLNPRKDGLGISVKEKGESMSSFDDYEKDEKYKREIMGVNSGPSMAMLEYFDYYLNFDGTFNYFRLPSHYHGIGPEMLKEVKNIVAHPKKIKFIKADKGEVEKLLKTLRNSDNFYKLKNLA
ncbi:MAG: copper amine oxidase N-terminal domain-containing protein [Peptoniphilus harei]|uniref:copper amine oxidase N-terminal domain-containing protein n=1 Tax=Peptoniphilus harei TaxID=54005 RepID=UPI002912D8EA|nr:copper amine oxidase N-terminal domain-containing protein [Peptoniphilus harei]MDU5470854.1 copper amine oxidase N-terminal domain-containing protein [Peptoniphilus harei]MDU6098769.1 copper amine oxidase N-terminal domain-containing protein [Peptoniphilus harei]